MSGLGMRLNGRIEVVDREFVYEDVLMRLDTDLEYVHS